MKHYPDALAPKYSLELGDESYIIRIKAHPSYLAKEIERRESDLREERGRQLVGDWLYEFFSPSNIPELEVNARGGSLSGFSIMRENGRGSRVTAREVSFQPAIPGELIEYYDDEYYLELADLQGIITDEETGETFFGLDLKKRMK